MSSETPNALTPEQKHQLREAGRKAGAAFSEAVEALRVAGEAMTKGMEDAKSGKPALRSLVTPCHGAPVIADAQWDETVHIMCSHDGCHNTWDGAGAAKLDGTPRG